MCGIDAGVHRKAANPCLSSPESAFLICFIVADLQNARSEALWQTQFLFSSSLSLFSAKHVNEVIVGTEQLMEI